MAKLSLHQTIGITLLITGLFHYLPFGILSDLASLLAAPFLLIAGFLLLAGL